jgi:hypothetical protein
MIDIEKTHISALSLESIVVVGLVLVLTYLLIRFIKRYLFFVVKSEYWIHKIEDSWARIELTVWFVMGFILLVYMLNQSFLITVVLLTVVFLVGGRYWRDILNGIIIKFENRIAKGDFLSNDQYSGVIVDLGYRGLQIRMDKGEVGYIPYRGLSDYKVRKLERDLKSELCTISVKFKAEISVDVAIQKLKVEILQIPYTMLTKPVKIEVIDVDGISISLRAIVHTQNSESGKLVEVALFQALRIQNYLME